MDWDGTNQNGQGVSTGIYLYRLRTEDFVYTKKMVLLDGLSESPQMVSNIIPSDHEVPILPKPGALNVTIRCTSPFTPPTEQKNVLISSTNFRHDIQLEYTNRSPINPDAVIVSEPTENQHVYVSGIPGAIMNKISGVEKVVITNKRTGYTVDQRVSFNSGIILLELPAVAGDELEFSLTFEGKTLGLPETITVNKIRPPAVVVTKPTHGDKDIIITRNIFISFSEQIDISTISPATIFLTDDQGEDVTGSYSFLRDDIVVCFDPEYNLKPDAEYTLTIKSGIKDKNGMTIKSDMIVKFTTAKVQILPQIAYSQGIRDSSSNVFDGGCVFTISSDGQNKQQLTNPNIECNDFSPRLFSRCF